MIIIIELGLDCNQSRNAFELKNEDDYESMDEKLQDMLEAKEGVDPLAPGSNLENRRLEKNKYIRTAHGDLLGRFNTY